jgi:hypothetical protein
VSRARHVAEEALAICVISVDDVLNRVREMLPDPSEQDAAIITFCGYVAGVYASVRSLGPHEETVKLFHDAAQVGRNHAILRHNYKGVPRDGK